MIEILNLKKFYLDRKKDIFLELLMIITIGVLGIIFVGKA